MRKNIEGLKEYLRVTTYMQYLFANRAARAPTTCHAESADAATAANAQQTTVKFAGSYTAVANLFANRAARAPTTCHAESVDAATAANAQ